MNYELKVAMLPLDIALGEPEVNLQHVEAFLRSTAAVGLDVLVLPELFSTGFTHCMSILGEPMSGPTMSAITRMARQYDLAICGSYAARIGAWLYNRAFFVEPNGEDTTYDKHHLFCLSRESKTFAKGDALEPPRVRYRGFTLALAICYDIRFPVWCRMRQSRPYDVLVVPANWPEARGWAWQSLLTARAIENQAFVVACNRTGKDAFGTYTLEMTQAYDPLGKTLGQSLTQWPSAVFATLRHELVSDTRREMPFSQDADDFVVTT